MFTNKYHFTGKVQDLKNLDYKFSKIGAANCKSYFKEISSINIWFFVYKKFLLQIDNMKYLEIVALVDFIDANKDKPKEFWVQNDITNNSNGEPAIVFKDVGIYVVTKTARIITFDEWCDISLARNKKISLGEDYYSDQDGREPFYIDLSIVEAIRELLPFLAMIEVEENK